MNGADGLPALTFGIRRHMTAVVPSVVEPCEAILHCNTTHAEVGMVLVTKNVGVPDLAVEYEIGSWCGSYKWVVSAPGL